VDEFLSDLDRAVIESVGGSGTAGAYATTE